MKGAAMDLTLEVSEGARFSVRAAVLLVEAGRVLLQGDERMSFLVLPGGRCRVGESSRQAADRELREELGPVARVDRLLWIVENFFELDGCVYHEHAFYYLATLSEGPRPYDRAGRFRGLEGGPQFFEWVPFAELHGLELYPQFLAERIESLPQTVEHAVINEPAEA